MKNLAIAIIALVSLALVLSCTYNKEELPEPIQEPIVIPTPTPTPAPNPTPNTPSITYTSHIKTVIDNNCVGCHGASGGVSLGTYTQVKAQADAGRILARAINGSGNGPMPPGGLMPQNTLDTLQMWLDQGALE